MIDAALDRNHAVPYRNEQSDLIVTPALLTDSEQQFVELLREYWAANKDTVHAGQRTYLLRNLSKGKGVGFFESEGFYPDFILWHILSDGRQRLVFIEPHGMRQEDAPDVNNKVKIAREIGQHLNEAIRASGCPIAEVTAFIISATPFKELSRKHGAGWTKERYAEHHILFSDTIPSEPFLGGILRSST